MKKKNYFLRALLIYCLVLAVILGAALFTLNRFLVAYEESRPDNSMEYFMASHGREHWISGLQNLISEGFNEFTITTAIPADFGIDEAGEITWRSAGGDDNTKYYDVRIGSTKICTLTLTPGENVGFGMNDWVVSSEEFHMPGGADIVISVPSGCTALINGIAVGSGYISGMDTLSVELNSSFDKAPASDVYLVEDMMGPAEIIAYDLYGQELEAVSLSANEVEFRPEATNSFCFYTLPDAEVKVNGTDISGEYCVTVGDELGIELIRYECDGLYAEPEISVLSGGKSVAPTQLGIGSCFIPGASTAIEGEMAEFLEDFIYAYVDFTANKNRAADANFAVLAQYLVSGSEFYTLTANSIENIVWATTSGLVYNSIDYSDIIPLGNGRFICNISYDISYTLGSRDLDVQSGHTILIEEHDGKYRVAALAAEMKS